MLKSNSKLKFQRSLIKWFKDNQRNYPWRYNTNPYQVLIAEMMLQQTNADKVAEIYIPFLHKFPNPQRLSRAKVEQLIIFTNKIGLHYKAKRLIQAAKQLMSSFNGIVPAKESQLLTLIGVGQYISNAVLCFAYSKKVPIVDVNVARIYDRVFGIKSEKRRASEDNKIWDFSKRILPVEGFKEFNWALIDICATICLKKSPKCAVCPISSFCRCLIRDKEMP
jgi:A/G-specific adenine glycosylase